MIAAMTALTAAMAAEHWTTWWIDGHCIWDEKNRVVRLLLQTIGLDGWLAVKVVYFGLAPFYSWPSQIYWAAGVFAFVAAVNGWQIWKVKR